MKASKFLIGLFLTVGLVLLVLTNLGVLSFRKSFIHKLSNDLPAHQPVVVFVNVNLVPMDSERVLEGQTVIVRDGVIEMLGSSEQVQIPDDALVVDGQGKYLMPGLVDMHVHIQSENDPILFVANGVTSVRNMWGIQTRCSSSDSPINWRCEIRSNRACCLAQRFIPLVQ